MKISGLTILRDAVRLGYPFVESLRSLLPLVDELVVGIGDGEDGTWETVQAIGDPKLKMLGSVWDRSLRRDGLILSAQTNLALGRCTGDWAVYLQADEVLHEDDLQRIYTSLRRNRDRRTEGLLFDYLHFVGSYDTVGADWRIWYPRAVRAVKLGMGIESVGDACGFRVRTGGRERGLIKAPAHARIFHYGWCRPPAVMVEKQKNLDRLYDADDAAIDTRYRAFESAPHELFASRGTVRRRFHGSHPQAMHARVAAQDWITAPARFARLPAGIRFVGCALAHPFALSRRDLSALVPTSLGNAGWLAFDAWHALTHARLDAQ